MQLLSRTRFMVGATANRQRRGSAGELHVLCEQRENPMHDLRRHWPRAAAVMGVTVWGVWYTALRMTAKETTLREVGEMLAHVVEHMATKEDVARLDTRIDDLRIEMIDQFEHVEKQFHAFDDRLRDIASETAVIHRRVERLEELGASNAGFAKEIDHLLTRVAAIEEHLKINKKIAA